jgi:hypothetical protein
MRALLLGLMHKTATVCGEWSLSQKEHADDLEQLLSDSSSFMEKAQGLDMELENFMESRSSEWTVTTVSVADVDMPSWLSALYQAPGAPTSILSTRSFNIAHRCNYWRATRLVLCCTMLSAIDLQLSVAIPTAAQTDDLTTIQTLLELRILGLIDNICDAFFFIFTLELNGKPKANTIDEVCGLRGFTLLWPLYRAGMCFKRSSLKAMDIYGRGGWIRTAMKFLADELCIAKAQAFLNNMDGLYGDIYL